MCDLIFVTSSVAVFEAAIR